MKFPMVRISRIPLEKPTLAMGILLKEKKND